MSSWLVHTVRVAVVVGLLLAIESPNMDVDSAGSPPSVELFGELFPSAVGFDPKPDGSGLWTLRDASDEKIAKIARTLPIASDIVGYRGPTESVITFDDELNIQRVRLIYSADTQEHVAAVKEDEEFFEQFVGWPWGGPAGDVDIDAVSGATLTSLALAEGVLKRIGGERPSLVFSDPVTAGELAEWLSDEESGKSVIRTGQLSDDIAGYQGPTELLMKLDEDEKLERAQIRYSYDNEKYVRYVKMEAGFWALFQGKTLEELAAFDPEAAGVEGVSGATMTSLAVADTIVAAAKAHQQKSLETKSKSNSDDSWLPNIRWTLPDVVCIAIVILLAIISRAGWFRNKVVRRVWLIAMVVVIGLWAGNLVSIALIAGWSAEGIAWRLAPGLATIAAAALLMPPLTKGNPYCNHLCPHGAVQQLIRPQSKSRRRLAIPAKWSRVLSWVPGTTLVVAYLVLITNSNADLSSWEPFHAYLFRIAGWVAIGLAIGSLIFAACVPMGYCRLGCPTGRLLDHLRRTASSSKVELPDYVSILLLVFAAWMRLG